MAGSTFQPPIHLDPNQDSAQQVAFINQNFQNLAATLESNSFRIVDTLEQVIASPAFNTGSNTWATQNTTINQPHNLPDTPIVIGVVALDGTSQYALMPDTKGNVTAGSPYFFQWQAYADETNITFWINVTAYNLNVISSNYRMKVYLLQLVGN